MTTNTKLIKIGNISINPDRIDFIESSSWGNIIRFSDKVLTLGKDDFEQLKKKLRIE